MDLHLLGLVFAISAMFSWAVGDFYIQKGTRIFGDWETLFIIGGIGGIALLPFIYKELPALFSSSYDATLLITLSCVCLFAALFLFEGMKRGKLSVIEPVFGLELPFTVAFSAIFINEVLTGKQYLLISLIFIGLILVVIKNLDFFKIHRTLLEKGVIFAGIGSIGMGLMNFMTGFASVETSPLLTIWFMHTSLAILCGFYILFTDQFKTMIKNIKQEKNIALSIGIFDNAAWILFAYAMTLIPFSISTAISECYIALSIALGIYVNREKVKAHQVIGILITFIAVIILAYLEI